MLSAGAAVAGGAEYTVYPPPVESPHHTTPLPPADARQTVVDPADATASPFGWHDTDGAPGAEHTTLEGNNVHAFDNNDPPLPDPDCGATLSCDFPLDLTQPPAAYRDASLTHLFFWLNLFHDVTYRHGFDEAAGNFQLNNYGHGGVAGDPVEASIQDDLTCAPNVAFGPDGTALRVLLSPCQVAGTTRDMALDAGAVLHLATHGLTARRVGGPANTGCLNHPQTPAEGWSDLLGLIFTIEPGDAGGDRRTLGTWAFAQGPDGPGIRAQPYSTDPALNTWTYESIRGLGDPFSIGAVWAQALWEACWALIDAHGFDPDLHDPLGGAGNQRALLYIVEGLALTACSPTFLDARDGVLQAALDHYGGEDLCRLWQAFAAFGLGADATTAGPATTDVSNGFAVPTACLTVHADGFESGDCSAWSTTSPPC